MNILGIDTTQSWLNLVFVDENRIINAVSEQVGNKHAEQITGALDRLLEKSHTAIKDIGLIAVTIGPGSFTGLRVGISFAKGLAMALDVKCLALNTLDVMAGQAGISDGTVSPMIDARKEQVYTALYNVANGIVSRSSDYQAIDPGKWLGSLPENTAILGSGANVYSGSINECNKSVKLLENRMPSPDPESLYKSLILGLSDGKAVSHFELDAFYIRPADAIVKPKKSKD